MNVSITILTDNHAAESLEAEHGFALWIETPGQHILFDTGRGDALLRNAEALGINLGLTDIVVLSHGHYDHTGNLAEVFRQAPHAQLYLHPDALLERYSIHEQPKPIGMPEASREALKRIPGEQCHWITGPLQIAERVWLTGPVPRETTYEDTGGPFFLDTQGKQPDVIADDLSLWIETQAGQTVCLGCCHAGVINTLDFIRKMTNNEKTLVLLGGMHLLHAQQERLQKTGQALATYAIPHLYPCHCTGEKACVYLKDLFGASVQVGTAGMKIHV